MYRETPIILFSYIITLIFIKKTSREHDKHYLSHANVRISLVLNQWKVHTTIC